MMTQYLRCCCWQVTSYSEFDLQKTFYTLHDTTKQFRMKISQTKSEVMAFKGQFPVRGKIVINKNILEM